MARGSKMGVKRGNYNIPSGKITSSFILTNSSRGLTDPKRADELIYKTVEKTLKELGTDKIADDYYNSIVKTWSTHGKDKSRVVFKTKIIRNKDVGVDLVTTMTGPALGMERFHMVDSRGREGGALISVKGQMVHRTRQVKQYYTPEYNKFDFSVTSKGKPRKRKISAKGRKAVIEKHGLEFELEDKRTLEIKLMPMREYQRKSGQPQFPTVRSDLGTSMGESQYLDPGEGKYGKKAQYRQEVIQGAVEPRGYTKAFLSKYVSGGSNKFRKDIRNAVRRALTVIKNDKGSTRMGKARAAHKAAKAAAAPAYTGKGNYVGKTRASKGRGTASKR